ncbi:PaaI family thioesterase [Chloroflexota bacterium]
MPNITPELKASLENAPYPHLLGFRLLELSEGYARVSVTIRPEHANFQGTPDGAFVMSLADYASACACNTLGQTRVGAQFNIHFIAAVPLESELTAEARTVHAGRTMALTEASVTDANGRIIAKASGTAITKPN